MRFPIWALGGGCALILLLQVKPATGQAVDDTLEVGYSSRLFQDVDPQDARAATMVWIQQYMKRIGRDEQARTIIFDSVAEAERGVASGEIDMLVLLPSEYLALPDYLAMIPILVPIVRGHPGYTYGLLGREGTTLDDLAGKDLLLSVVHKRDLLLHWLNQVLSEGGHPEGHSWLGDILPAERAASAILAVFFGDADGCVVPMTSFETMVELNPQLGRELTPLATSSLFPSSVICVRPDVQVQYGDVLEEGMQTLHKTPEGRQVLDLFGLDRLVKFREEHLDSVRDLLDRPSRPDTGPQESP